MPPKKEACRNFQRGSCKFGDRCRFAHDTPQQSKPNPFGFGLQNQQQKPNPFGFGVQNTQPNNFGPNQNQPKPFDNKWSRFSPINNATNSTPSRSENQSSASPHTCTDSDSCKRQIAEDFRNERPMWRLTCYGHLKNGPCDIVGDASYEELRAVAYDEAKRGVGVQSIIERERNLVQAKLLEFESLVSNPYTGPSRLVPNLQNPSHGVSPNITLPLQSNGGPPPVSSFGQLATSLGNGSSSTAPNSVVGQPNSFQNVNSGPSSNNAFSPSSSFPNPIPNGNSPFQNLPAGPQNSNSFSQFQNLGGNSSSAFGQKSIFASQSSPSTQQIPFNSNTANHSNGASGAEKNPFASFTIPPQTSSSVFSQPQNSSIGATPNAIGQSLVNPQLTNGLPRESNGDDSIWMKSNWIPGEIPDEAPPDKYIF